MSYRQLNFFYALGFAKAAINRRTGFLIGKSFRPFTVVLRKETASEARLIAILRTRYLRIRLAQPGPI